MNNDLHKCFNIFSYGIALRDYIKPTIILAIISTIIPTMFICSLLYIDSACKHEAFLPVEKKQSYVGCFSLD